VKSKQQLVEEMKALRHRLSEEANDVFAKETHQIAEKMWDAYCEAIKPYARKYERRLKEIKKMKEPGKKKVVDE
jgi:hypothetical protein